MFLSGAFKLSDGEGKEEKRRGKKERGIVGRGRRKGRKEDPTYSSMESNLVTESTTYTGKQFLTCITLFMASAQPVPPYLNITKSRSLFNCSASGEGEGERRRGRGERGEGKDERGKGVRRKGEGRG
jgi:hypothetical protein